MPPFPHPRPERMGATPIVTDWAGHGWAAAEGSVPGSAPRPVAAPGLGSQQPLGAGHSCLDDHAAGHGWPLRWEEPSPGSRPSGCGPRAQDPLAEPAPTRTQQATVPGWHTGAAPGGGCVSRAPPACAWGSGRQGCGAHLSQCLTLPIWEVGASTAPLSEAVLNQKGDNGCNTLPHTVGAHHKHFTNSGGRAFVQSVRFPLFLSQVLVLCTHGRRWPWAKLASAGSPYPLAHSLCDLGRQPGHLSEPQLPQSKTGKIVKPTPAL